MLDDCLRKECLVDRDASIRHVAREYRRQAVDGNLFMVAPNRAGVTRWVAVYGRDRGRALDRCLGRAREASGFMKVGVKSESTRQA